MNSILSRARLVLFFWWRGHWMREERGLRARLLRALHLPDSYPY